MELDLCGLKFVIAIKYNVFVLVGGKVFAYSSDKIDSQNVEFEAFNSMDYLYVIEAIKKHIRDSPLPSQVFLLCDRKGIKTQKLHYEISQITENSNKYKLVRSFNCTSGDSRDDLIEIIDNIKKTVIENRWELRNYFIYNFSYLLSENFKNKEYQAKILNTLEAIKTLTLNTSTYFISILDLK